VSAVPRELARRLSGTVEVLLLWHPHVNRVELSVCDPATGAGFHIEVPPANALDALLERRIGGKAVLHVD
jgi:hypothetical protein